MIARARGALRNPPPGKQRQPSLAAASKASQKPINGPKEKAKKTRSAHVTPAAPKTCDQLASIQSQLSGVSSQRKGAPAVPLVWWQRVKRSRGKVRLLP